MEKVAKLKTVLVHGGSSILGKNVIKKLNTNRWRVINFDITENSDAAKNFAPSDTIIDQLTDYLRGERVESILCLDGFPVLKTQDVSDIDERMNTTFKSVEFATEFLESRGVLVVPTCIPPDREYLEKLNDEEFQDMSAVTSALVFHKTLSEVGSQSSINPLPEGTRVIGLVPQQLSDEQVESISGKLSGWVDGFDTPANGAIIWSDPEVKDKYDLQEF